MRSEANRHSRPRHFTPDLEYFPLFVQEQYIDGKLHAKGMDRLARCDPKAFARIETGMLQKSGPSRCTGIGNTNAVTEDSVSGLVANSQFRHVDYSNKNEPRYADSLSLGDQRDL